MPKKIKLDVTELNVKSFTTNLSGKSDELKGGATGARCTEDICEYTRNHHCDNSGHHTCPLSGHTTCPPVTYGTCPNP